MSTELKFFHFVRGIFEIDVFCANHPELDRYVKNTMGQWEDNNVTRNYVALNQKGECVAIFSLSAASLKSSPIIRSGSSNLPGNIDLPAIKIGRFVVESKYRGSGIGKEALKKAIFLFIKASKSIGVIGLTVDAKDEMIEVNGKQKHVYEFYEKYGFKRITETAENGCYPMLLYTQTIRKQYPSLFQESV